MNFFQFLLLSESRDVQLKEYIHNAIYHSLKKIEGASEDILRKYPAQRLLDYQRLSADQKSDFQNNLISVLPKPTRAQLQKLLKWLLSKPINNRNGVELFVSGEDNDSIRHSFDIFEIAKKDRNFKGKKDLGQYSTYEEWIKVVSEYEYENQWIERKKDTSKKSIPEDREVTLLGQKEINGNIYELYEIGWNAIQKIGQPQQDICLGKWCVKDPRFHSNYDQSENLFMVVENGFYRYLFHIANAEFTNAANVGIDTLPDKEKTFLYDQLLPTLRNFMPENIKAKYREKYEKKANILKEMEAYRKKVLNEIGDIPF